MRPEIKREKLKKLLDTRFMKVYDYPFKEDGHYYTATRRTDDDLVMLKSDSEYKKMTADAVTCMVVIEEDGKEPKLLMNYEFRYALGRFLMAPPAGLVDPEDLFNPDALLATAKREIEEETGIVIREEDKLFTINPLLFSSPGMTDESNAIVGAIIHWDSSRQMNHNGSLGSEVFDGFSLLSMEEAKELIKKGRDNDDLFYSVYTWICMMAFVSQIWN